MIKRILSLFFICIFSVQNLFAFGSKTHKALTTFAAQKATTNNYQILKYLQQYCNKPDEDDYLGSRSLFYSHFFDPEIYIKQKNDDFMGSLLCQKTKNMFGCEVPINASVAAYKYFFDALEEADKLKEEQGLSTYEKVFESLGMAIHYVQDMCCLVHQVTWSDNLVSAVRGFHTEYENNVDKYVEGLDENFFSCYYIGDFSKKITKYKCESNKFFALNFIKEIIETFVLNLYRCYPDYYENSHRKVYNLSGEIDKLEILYAYYATYCLIVFFLARSPFYYNNKVWCD